MIPAVIRHLAESTAFALVISLVAFFLRRSGAATRHTLWIGAIVKFALPAALFVYAGERLRGLFPATQLRPGISVVVSQWAAVSPSWQRATTARGGFDPVMVVWLLGSVVMFAVWLRGLWSFDTTRATEAGTGDAALRTLKARIGLRREVALRVCDSVEEPVLVGFLRPQILIPSGLAGELSQSELESVILHEMAHAKRRDNWTAALAHTLTCMFWFYPVMWWMEKRLRHEGEFACDEMVVAAGASANDYVAGILKVCRLYWSKGVVGVSGIGSTPNPRNRVEAIMSMPSERRARRAPRPLLGGLMAVTVAVPLIIGLLAAPGTQVAEAFPPFTSRATVPRGTGMHIARQPGAPAHLIQTTHGIKDLLLGAKLENTGSQAITQYRIGWVAVYGNRKIEAFTGPPMNLPSGIAPGAVHEVPAQGVNPRIAEDGALGLTFFVNNVQFADSHVWHADIEAVKNEARSAEGITEQDGRNTESVIACAAGGTRYPEGSVIQMGDSGEQMCVRVLDASNTRERDPAPRYRAQWIHTSEAIRQRSARVIHVPEQAPVFCSPKASTRAGLCACEESGEFSQGAIVNPAKGAFQLRCDQGKWIQTSTLNLKANVPGAVR